MCTTCLHVAQKPTCIACWSMISGGGCLKCHAPVSTTQASRFRFCVACYTCILVDIDDDALRAACFYWDSYSGDLRAVGCMYEPSCPGHVNVCGSCRQVHENIPCTCTRLTSDIFSSIRHLVRGHGFSFFSHSHCLFVASPQAHAPAVDQASTDI